MRISIITVCLNQADSIEAAMRSVLAQAERTGAEFDLEYIVVDGGSTDGTVDVIRLYADRLASWTSEPDRGQSHALNKGFSLSSGEVLGWLNADDLLLPGALSTVAEAFAGRDCDVLCGGCRYEYPDGSARLMGVPREHLRMLEVYDPIYQPSCFWRRAWHERVGGLREDLHFGMDWDLWLRFWRSGARFATIDSLLSVYRMTGSNKTATGAERRNRELYALLREHNARGTARLLTELSYHALWPLKRLRQRSPSWFCRPLSNLCRTTVLLALGPILGFDRLRCCTHPFS